MFGYRPLESLIAGGNPSSATRKPAVLLTLYLGLAVACTGIIYVCVPRTPTFCFGIGYPSKFSASFSKASVSIPFNVSVANPNFYGIYAHQTLISLKYMSKAVSSDAKTPVTLSTISAPSLHIKARGNSTSSFTAILDSTSSTVSSDMQILKDCAASGATTLYISAAITILRWIHVSIPSEPFVVKCSISARSIAKLVPDSQSHISYFCNTV